MKFFSGASINTNAIGENFVKSEGSGFLGDYTRHKQNPFAIILSDGIDPEDVNTPINVNFGAFGGKSFDFENGSRLSVFGTVSFENSYEYRRRTATDFTLVEKKVFEQAEEFEYSTTTTAMAAVNYKIDDQNKLKFNSLFINSSSNEVGYFGIDGKGRNRDAIYNLGHRLDSRKLAPKTLFIKKRLHFEGAFCYLHSNTFVIKWLKQRINTQVYCYISSSFVYLHHIYYK